MTKTQKKAMAAALRKALADTQKKWDAEGAISAAYCYGFLIGVMREAIYQLEN